MKIFRLIFSLILFFVFIRLEAQGKLSLNVSQAVELALGNSKVLHSSLMKVKNSEAKVKEAMAFRLPSVKLNARYTRLSEVDPFVISTPFGSFPIAPGIYNNYAIQLTLSQPIFTGFRLSGNVNLNEKLNEATNEDYNKDKSELIFNVKNSYFNTYKSILYKKVLDEMVIQIGSHLQDVKNLEKVGMMAKNDVLKIEIQYSNVLFQQVDAENLVNLSRISLNNVLGIDLSTLLELTEEIKMTDVQSLKMDDLIYEAMSNRSELKSAEARIDAGKAGVILAQSNWYPQINAYGNYYYSRPNQRIMPSKDQFDATWDAGVVLSMNIWDWLSTKHQTDQAEALLAQAKDGLNLIKDGISLEVTSNYFNINQAEKKIKIAKLSVEQAEENNRVTSDKFKMGMATSSEIIDSETALITAKTNYTNAIIDYELAKAKLEKSISKKFLENK